jgi:pimeloyl-ACP methyl ester carboxylesterase
MQSVPQVLRLSCAGGGEIEACFSCTDSRAGWAVVYVHGLGSTRSGEKSQALQAACTRRRWNFCAFDFRGHGGSTGTLLDLRGSALLDDLETLRAFLAERGIRRLCLIGSSMGAWASGWFAVRQPEAVSACVFIAPGLRFPGGLWSRLGPKERQQWKETGRLRLRNQWLDAEIGYGVIAEQELFAVEKLAAAWSKPLLIYHGLADDVVPWTVSMDFVQQARGSDIELRLLKAGDHRLTVFKDEIAEAACEFFARHSNSEPEA